MKLVRLTSMAVAAAAVALACGCSSTPAPKAAGEVHVADSHATGTTSLMSAELPGAAPKVGKAHLAVDDELEVASADDAPTSKATRRSDGSRRGGGFGSIK